MVARLNSVFDEVKRTFYPRWDTANEWKARRKGRLSHGYTGTAMCSRETKTIDISRSYVAQDDEELRCLFAHEICHAVTTASHGQEWQRRLLRVADRASELGQKQLVDKLHREIQTAHGARRATLPAIQHSIEDALFEQPDASFDMVINWAANDWALTADGLLKKYKNLKTFFERAKRRALLDSENPR
jgi:hypothetical protein